MPTSLAVVVRARHGALTAETASCGSISSQTPQSLARVVTSSARPKKRKATCKARTDEIKQLQDEENELKAAVERVKQAKRATHMLKLSKAAHQFTVFQSSLEQSNGVIASAKSLIGSALEHNPLYTRIRLPARSSMDRQLILGMARGPQLRKAAKYIVERVRFQNLNRSLRQAEIAEGEGGDFWFSQLDIMPFKGARGVKLVLDQIDSFMRYHEFIVLENLDITVLQRPHRPEIQTEQSWNRHGQEH
ncbi:hypothetical protein Poli38472_002019 [Pythium oligandrum]|uniref:Uncharacterized protein n=1 Tax=Pythium oligandrum TaxID=41045 RepID=A0A8K1CX57_PYTOL|nr:hypothetical protein Poli38472_002019 [Pythium oligandrum]|eukprot:TMW69863.1 hypothetical protein Poli38472_002019 [Pythium oligandrum]